LLVACLQQRRTGRKLKAAGTPNCSQNREISMDEALQLILALTPTGWTIAKSGRRR